MWAHYAQNHEGFVLEFNKENSFFNQSKSIHDQIRRLYKIIYSSERPEIELYDSEKEKDALLKSLINNIMLTKSYDWQQEKEWRMIMELKEADEIIERDNSNIYLFNIPKDLILSIYLGTRMTQKNKNELFEAVKGNGINPKIYQSYLDQKEYKLNFKEIEV